MTAPTATTAPTARIATKPDSAINVRCARCRVRVAELDVLATAPGAAKPVHFQCLSAVDRARRGEADEAFRCWYDGCPLLMHRNNVCRGHYQALYA